MCRPPRRHGVVVVLSQSAGSSALIPTYLEHVRLDHTMASTSTNGYPPGHVRVSPRHPRFRTSCRCYVDIISDAEAMEAHNEYLYQEKDVIDDEERWGNVI